MPWLLLGLSHYDSTKVPQPDHLRTWQGFSAGVVASSRNKTTSTAHSWGNMLVRHSQQILR